jgi:hypothetical protein
MACPGASSEQVNVKLSCEVQFSPAFILCFTLGSLVVMHACHSTQGMFSVCAPEFVPYLKTTGLKRGITMREHNLQRTTQMITIKIVIKTIIITRFQSEDEVCMATTL